MAIVDHTTGIWPNFGTPSVTEALATMSAFLSGNGFTIKTGVTGGIIPTSNPNNFIAYTDATGVVQDNISPGRERVFFAVYDDGADNVHAAPLQWADMSSGVFSNGMTGHTLIRLGNADWEYHLTTDGTNLIAFRESPSEQRDLGYVGLGGRNVGNDNRVVVGATANTITLSEDAPVHWFPEFWGTPLNQPKLKIWNQGAVDNLAEVFDVLSVVGNVVTVDGTLTNTYNTGSIVGNDPAPTLVYRGGSFSGGFQATLIHSGTGVGTWGVALNTPKPYAGTPGTTEILDAQLCTRASYATFFQDPANNAPLLVSLKDIPFVDPDTISTFPSNEKFRRLQPNKTHFMDYRGVRVTSLHAVLAPVSAPFVP